MRQLLVVGSLVGVLALAAPADAGGRSWYLGIEGGVEFDGRSGSDNGWGGFVTIGSGLGSHISLEAELGYRSTSVNDGFLLDADIEQTSLMFNVLYEVPIDKAVSFVAGGGIGGETVMFDGFVYGADDSEIELAAQLKLGVSVAVSASTDLVANYRYMSALGDLGIDNSTLTVGISFDL